MPPAAQPCAPEPTVPQRIAAASAGSLVVAGLFTPLDVARVRLQAQAGRLTDPAGNSKCTRVPMDNLLAGCINWVDREKVCRHKCSTTGTIGALRSIARHEGVRGLYAGILPTLAMSIPSNVLYFTAYDMLRDWLAPYMHGRVAPLAAGAVARTAATAAAAPFELLRTRYQGGKHGGLVHIARSYGPLALWSGTAATLGRDIPFSAIYWLGVEEGRSALAAAGWDRLTATFIAGGISGGLSAALTQPFDVVKTRRQLALAMEGSDHGLWRTFREVRAQEGAAALYAGLFPRVAKVSPACAIMIGVYEAAKRRAACASAQAAAAAERAQVVAA
eukprot:TRINITY_DN834_c1_g1_i1.p1 TRINITY_DN834_c1_g1~~TRINITY_DN834_c1_g1_i1.p1  ORF type:complete len:332 (+),score=88.24 TRINITY_DN834_c1_g1_i1:70-1065(+)